MPARLNQSRHRPRLRGIPLSVVLAVLFSASARHSTAQTAPPPLPPLSGPSLIAELGCVLCHMDSPGRSSLRDQTPDLGGAGLRYRPAYLYDFLLKPAPVRRHLGRARMPSFHLTSKEAVALALFLESQTNTPSGWPELPSPLRERLSDPPRAVSKAEFDRQLGQGLACLTCHTLDGAGGNLGPELGSIGYQLQPGWIKAYLVAPARFGVPSQVMPAQFYQLSSSKTHYEELVPNAADRIVNLVDHLSSRAASTNLALESRWKRAREAHPNLTPADGEKLFRAFNCAACHRHPTVQPRSDRFAPGLASEGSRVKVEWLLGYLKKPTAIRPAGSPPMQGARMPDFRLREDEARMLAQFLATQTNSNSDPAPQFEVQPLSAFSRNKAQSLLETKLSCLGCHQLGENGGRIGPNLSATQARLQPAYVFSIIDSPGKIAPHSVMPDIPLPRKTVELLANHLLQGGWQTTNMGYLSPLEFPLDAIAQPVASNRTPAANYQRYCASCHGSSGRGDGFNAAFLKTKPTAHADAGYLARRPDDTLFDGIHSGGFILNRSPLMPPWGNTLSAREIRDLVQHLRRLCQCEGPAWSRDGDKASSR